MQDNSYQVYLRSVLNLAGTIVIKSHDSAKLLNTYIDTYLSSALYDPMDMRTWKYYKNVCGEYFPTDTMMQVRSSDTLELIDFTKENLQVHRNTALDYQYGTRQYQELVSLYPMQVQLILGIIYPVDMQTLIDAPDNSIVGWGPAFVESHEFQLIEQLNAFVQSFFSRWLIEGFKRTDELYLASLYAVLYSELPAVILAIRAAAYKTRFAHSYHVQQYLSSHSNVGGYTDYMTRTQAMFAYRNIAYIERNSGSQNNFDWMIERLLSPRDIPIAKFGMRHDVGNLPNQLAADVYFSKEPINTVGNIDGRDRYNLTQLLDLEEKVDPANRVNRETHYEEIDHALTYASQNEMPTKVFESTIIDYSDSEKNRWTDVALNNWAWLAHMGLYTAYITVQAPSSGAVITVNAKDAFTLYVYCLINSLGYTINDVPSMTVHKVARIHAATKEEVASVCGSRVGQHWIDGLHATMPRIRKCISVQAFNQYATELFIAANQQWNIVSQNEALHERGQLENAALQMWSDETFYLGDSPGQMYAEWFTDRNLSMGEYNEVELAEIADLIMEQVTGIELNDNISMKNVQKAMVGLLTQLSSYSIQVGASINAGPILNAGMLQLRLDDYTGFAKGAFRLKTAVVYLSGLKGKPHHSLWCDLTYKTFEEGVSVKSSATVQNDISVIPAFDGGGTYSRNKIHMTTKYRSNIGLGGWVETEPLPQGLAPTVNVPGLAQWLRMPEEYRLSAKSAWHVEV